MENVTFNFRGMVVNISLYKDELIQMQVVGNELIIDITLYGLWVRQVRFGFEQGE